MGKSRLSPPMPLVEEAQKAARTLLDHAYVRIVARAEPDATCAAALLAHALRRESIDFHVSWTRRMDDATLAQLALERPDCLVLVGLGGDAASAEPVAGRRLVLETGAPTFTADATLHADAALGSLAHLIAAGVSRRNGDLALLAIAGAVSGLRHVRGWRGLDAEILQEAIEDGVVLREAALALHGPTLLQALAQLDAPYVAGVTGRARNARKLASDLKLHGESPPGALASEDAQRVGDLLTLRLLQQGAPDAALDVLLRPALRGLKGPHTGLEAGELARLAEAACATGRPGLAFAALWPDASSGGEMVDVSGAIREEIVAALLRAERDARPEGRFLVAEAPRGTLCAPLADRLAVSSAPEGTIVAVHAAETEGARIVLRGWGPDLRALAQRAAPAAGAIASGDAHAAQMWAPDATRALKALDDALGEAAP